MGILDLFSNRSDRHQNQADQTVYASDAPLDDLSSTRKKPYLAFLDVETPNCHNDRVCSIGLIVSDKSGHIEDKRYELVNPEVPFDYINTNIHGIRQEDVAGSITFPILWDSCLKRIADDCVFVAHNAYFDMNVIYKSLTNYDICPPNLTYGCTLSMARSLIELPSYKLPHVCSSLGIEIGGHHHALDDAQGCFDVYWELVRRFNCHPIFQLYEPKTYTRKAQSTNIVRELSEKTATLRDTKRLLEEIASDGVVSSGEAAYLLSTLLSNDDLRRDPSISLVIPSLQEALSDGSIDRAESDAILSALERIINPATTECSNIEIKGHIFVLTGAFSCGTKASVVSLIEERGGTVLKDITKKCNYVVIGENGSAAYSMGNYGSKVKKAMDWQSKGLPIKIIREDELLASIR